MISQSTRTHGWWGLLPPIVDDEFSGQEQHDGSPDAPSRRWWLPLSDTAMTAMSLALSNEPDQASRSLERRLMKAMASDPPLLFFAMLNAPTGALVALSELAGWFLTDEFHSLVCDNEWLLAAPQLNDAQQRQWSWLKAKSVRRDPQTWGDDLGDWLKVLGPDPAGVFTDRLPRLIWDLDEQDNSVQVADGSQLLHRLAQSARRQRNIESQFLAFAEEQKLASAKQLAYGLSHEINNPLANISARAQSLAHQEDDPRRRESLEQITRQVYRAHEMIAGLMFYANPSEPEFERVDLAEVASEAFEEFRAQLDLSSADLILHLPDGPAEVIADRLMMLEALRVLLRNAVEAVQGRGTIVVSLGFESGAAKIGEEESIESRACWNLSVADSGPGLTEEARRHAFDPYYSGREAGRGLGLGLCRALRIAELHQASISLSSGLAGCVATLLVPAAG
ncbi:sensor histidine kinase [Roseiconus lacunae]|uniref:sensor histidine kinase n=1 Tax=Roseiconus lacunae TaxID=2605694 RepID=UPI001358E09A|nr:HAMP domain-containing sensor histidine kinase [Roseiconus lacunae]